MSRRSRNSTTASAAARLRSLTVAVAAIAATLTLAPAASVAAAAPDPVILVTGTISPEFTMAAMQSRLGGHGYDAHIFELPGLGIGDIVDSSVALEAFVDSVLAQTGASDVDLVAHSQGGLVARYYVKNLGGDAVVDSLVMLGSPNNGTALANFGNLFGVEGLCEACGQMAIGSAFLADLNAGDDTIGSVDYTNIYTSYDEIVFPAATARMNDGATNVRLQSRCWFRVVGHVGLLTDGAVYDGVRDALRHRSVRPNCWAF